MQKNLKEFISLLSPSWLSGTLTALAAAAIVLVSVVASHGTSGSLQQGLFAARDLSTPTYRQVTDNLAKNEIISNIPLFLFWTGIGLVVYVIAVRVYEAIHTASELRKEMSYVNVAKESLVKVALTRGAIALVSVGAWFAYIIVFLHTILPYGLAASHEAGQFKVASDYLTIAEVSLLLLVAIHAHTVFLRLALLKRRVFRG